MFGQEELDTGGCGLLKIVICPEGSPRGSIGCSSGPGQFEYTTKVAPRYGQLTTRPREISIRSAKIDSLAR